MTDLKQPFQQEMRSCLACSIPSISKSSGQAPQPMDLLESGQNPNPAGRKVEPPMPYRLEDLIDLNKFQEMLDSLNNAVDITTGILDCDGGILTASGWQDICSSFHRASALTEAQCMASDQFVSHQVIRTDAPVIHHCPLGLVDSATPIVIDGKHLGNVFIGQFFLEQPDHDRFRKQAREYGFDENAYLQALAKVPVLSKEQLERNLAFIRLVAEILCDTGLKRLKLLQSEQRCRAIFDSVSEAIFIHDLETGKIRNVNAAMTAMYGYTHEEACCLSMEAHGSGIPPFTKTEALHYLREAAKGNKQTFEWHARRKDGSLFWCEVSMRRARIVDRDIIMATARDISNRKEAEELLHKREEEFHALVRNSPDAIVRFDLDCRRLYVNPAWEQSTGLSSANALGKTPMECCSIVSETVVEYQKKIAQVIATGASVEFEYPFQTLTGNNGWFHMRAVPERDRNGRITSVLAVANDITELKNAQNEILRSQKLESLGVMAAGIAHEFNNILCGVTGYITLALPLVGSGSQAESHLLLAKENTTRAAELVKKLSSFSHEGKPVKEKIDLERILEESLEAALQNSGAKGRITCTSDLDYLEADEGQIFQVCSNIINNGVQSMPGGGNMTIVAGNVSLEANQYQGLSSGRYVQISFTDEGMGITEEDQKRIFDPYFTRKSLSTGLGLASSYAIIQRHGGDIVLSSRLGIGTTFTVYLPSSGCKETITSSRLLPTTNQGMKWKALVMDDRNDIRQIASAMLSFLNFQAVTCNNGDEALALYKEAMTAGAPFAFVILDVIIPRGMNGTGTAEHILAIDPQARLIVSSGYCDEPIMKEFWKYGFVAALPKPYTIDELEKAISATPQEKRP